MRKRFFWSAALCLFVPAALWAHGGEDHAHEDDPPVAPADAEPAPAAVATPPPAPAAETEEADEMVDETAEPQEALAAAVTPSEAGDREATAVFGEPLVLAKESQFLLGLRTVPVALRPIRARLHVAGKVRMRTDRHAEIFAPLAGMLQPAGERFPMLGERVRKGQVLAYVEQTLGASEAGQLAAERIRAESGGSVARTALQQARRDLARLDSLRGVVAQKDIQAAQTAVRQAEQEVYRSSRERSLYAAAASGGRLARTQLVSPLEGVIVAEHAAAGERVDPVSSVFTVLDTSVVWIEAQVPAADIARIEAARDARLYVDAYPQQAFAAKLLSVGQIVDEGSQTVRVIFEAANPDGRLRPGLFLRVGLATGDAGQQVAVPDSAIVTDAGRTLVFVSTGPETFEAREVRLGGRDGLWHVAAAGLHEGERVVTTALYALQASFGR